jgi:hypothetical protein
LGATLKRWYGTTGASDATWPDLSGTGVDATQADSGKQASIESAVLGGQQVRRFNGTSDSFTFTTLTLNTNATWFVLCKESTATDAMILSRQGGNDSQYRANFSGTYLIYDGSLVQSDSVSNWDVWKIRAVRKTGTTYEFFENGTDLGGGTGSGTFQLGLIGQIGSADSQFFPGDMAEILICDSALSDSDMNHVGNYMEDWSGITWTDI